MSSKKNAPKTGKTGTNAKQTKASRPKAVEETPREDGRGSQRVPIQLLVDYQCGGNYLFDFCKDLGAGGVFIETNSPLDHGSEVKLVFTLPDSKETLEARGRVIWVQAKVPGKDLSPGMGVQFENFDNRQRKILEDFVARYHGNAFKSKEDTANKTA